ncbi:hypothetical protein AB0H69_00270 [Streptomyces phaeochromogenes]|uniref:hypothetical protein n=1 Tax=Streptomyces phaeochromogenes TaxID=1923 RepID=UPI0033E84BAA
MSVYQRSRDARPDKQQPLAARIMKVLRDRHDSGLPGATLDQVGLALRITDRSVITKALARLATSGKVTVDHGPQGLGDQRQPDRWSAASTGRFTATPTADSGR